MAVRHIGVVVSVRYNRSDGCRMARMQCEGACARKWTEEDRRIAELYVRTSCEISILFMRVYHSLPVYLVDLPGAW